MAKKIFSPSLAIEAMKDSGYKDVAHAVAELIDNSIQAGESISDPVSVEVICIEKDNIIHTRRSSQIERIAIYDNACGMDAEVLSMALAFGQGTRHGAKKGMGKFGMGLPNASISQCDRVDIWSWQNKKIYHTYLDIDEIKEDQYDEVPEPVLENSLPIEWVKKISTPIRDSGTLVVWSKLNRLKWKRHKAFFGNTEFIVGRMYRHYINEKKCSIRMAAFVSGNLEYDEKIVANDPLYLMSGTNAPGEFAHTPAFEPFGKGEWIIPLTVGSKKINVTLRFSIAKQDYRRNLAEMGKDAGQTDFGRHCKKNIGLSVVRAGRELELSHSFNIHYDPRERWWGAEVSFDPILDEVFGVTNNKQAANSFVQLTYSDIATEEGIPEGEVRKYLEEENDLRLPIIELSNEILSKLTSIRKQIEKQTKGVRVKRDAQKEKDAAQIAAEKIVAEDGQKGIKGVSDQKEYELTDEEKTDELTAALIEDGVEVDTESKDIILNDWLHSKYIFSTADIPGSRYVFDVSQPAGKIKVTINSKHPAYETLIRDIESEENSSYGALKLLFAAWARMEDVESAQDLKRQELLQEIRFQWGDLAKRMIDEYNNS
jgi:hypothetical protein